MIAISHLLEAQSQYKPWMVGTATQVGGKGYPTGDLRLVKPPPSALSGHQHKIERVNKTQTDQSLIGTRTKRNLTQAERAAGMA